MIQKGRKPIHLEQRGGKGNRQRIWEAIRSQRTGFHAYSLSRSAKVNYETVQTYLSALRKAGYIAFTGERDLVTGERWLTLQQDCGSEAPSLKRDGTLNRQGLGTESMWRALRILGECSAQELAAYASAATPTTASTAGSYLGWLAKAGYVQVIRKPGKANRYLLQRSRYTGPRPPMIQRTRQVYDPNLAKVVWAEAPEDLL